MPHQLGRAGIVCRIGVFAVVASLLCSMVVAQDLSPITDQSLRGADPLTCGFEAPSVALYRARGMSCNALVMRAGGRISYVNSLVDLRGHVQISTSEQALKFVRLKSSFETDYLLADSCAEIVPSRFVARMPTFGLSYESIIMHHVGSGPHVRSDYWTYYPEKGLFEHTTGSRHAEKVDIRTKRPNLSGYGNGLSAVLSDALFRKGRLSRARCVREGGAFVIDRWIYVWRSPQDTGQLITLPHIEHVREQVGFDGNYSKTVLETRDTDSVPHASFMAPPACVASF